MQEVKRVIVSLVILSILILQVACKSKLKYTKEDIRSMSISSSCMDYSYSYTFYLRKTDDKWLLDADCAFDTESERVQYEERLVDETDAMDLINLLDEEDLLEKIYRYKKLKMKVTPLDDTTYYTSVQFTDGEILGAQKSFSSKVETFFFELVKNMDNIER